MLDRATRGLPADFQNPAIPQFNDIYLIVHAVDGLAPGAYYFRNRERELVLLKEGQFRREAGYLGLGQEIPADCSVNVYFLTDLNRVLARFGNRGYRAAQLEAGIMGGKLYLAAYAQRLGASGLTFFDDDVTEFFSPDAAPKEKHNRYTAIPDPARRSPRNQCLHTGNTEKSRLLCKDCFDVTANYRFVGRLKPERFLRDAYINAVGTLTAVATRRRKLW